MLLRKPAWKAALVVALWCAGAGPPAQAASSQPAAPDQQLHLSADHVEASGLDAKGNPSTITAEGHVLARKGAMRLRGLHLFVTREPRQATLSGSVFGLDGLMVLTAQKLVYDLPGHSLALTDGRVAIKAGASPAELYRVFNSDHPEALWKTGHNALILSADRLTRTDEHEIVAEYAFLTTCSCPEGCRPLLSFTAPKIVVKPGESATLHWPVFRLFQVPFFALPWFQVPLSERRSGLLFPVVTWTGPGGLDVTVPYYITLGRSADLTVSLRYFGGTSNANVGGNTSASLGVRGFGDESELRWRPAQEAVGMAHFFHVYDTSDVTPGHGARGNREALQLNHVQPLLGGRLGLNIDAVSDNDVLLDTVLPLARRDQPYLRSWAQYAKSFGGTSFSLESNVIQDLRPGPLPCTAADQSLCGTEFSRTPALQLPGVVAPVAKAVVGQLWSTGKLLNDLQLTIAAEDSLPGSHFISGHAQRLISEIRLVQTLPLVGGRYGNVTLSGGERAQFLSLADPDQQGWRSGAYVDLLARSRIARTFASGLVHEIVPSVQIRALGVVQGLGQDSSIPFSDGLFPTTPVPRLLQSDLDLALPRYSTIQAITRLSTSLSWPGAPPVVLALEHHLALAPLDAGQLHPSLDFTVKGFHWNLNGGLDLAQQVHFTAANITVSRPIGVNLVSLGASYLDGATDDQVARGLDVLFTPRNELPPSGTVAQLVALRAGTNILIGQVRLVSALTLSKTLGPGGTLVQDYLVQVLYELEGCGKLSLALHWVHQVGQPYGAPIPTPNFEFLNPQGLATAVQSAATSPGY